MENERTYGFFAMTGRLRYIKRWSLMRSGDTENVAEHSYETAVLAYALASIGNRVFHRELNADRVASAALFHDFSEAVTGDMPTPVKYKSEEMRAVFGKVEEESRDRLLAMLPEELEGDFRPLLSLEEDDPETYRYVRAADKLSAYFKCLGESENGNREFLSAKETTRRALEELGLPEVEYFLGKFEEGYKMNLDELLRDGGTFPHPLQK
ncbi:MAG: 5'-deoxynucleotidase [Clostridia bacterium]|nr:5'-deoxynucleotidase [Clostridia bacterium]